MEGRNTNERSNLQESLKKNHMQGSLHPADPDMRMSAGKGYVQKSLDPAGQSSLSQEQAGAPVQEK